MSLAFRAAQPGSLDRVLAAWTGGLGELAQLKLGGLRIELALALVDEELRRPQDRVDERAHERKQRGDRRDPDEDGIFDPPARVREGPPDQGKPDHDQEKDEQVDGKIEIAVFDSEQRDQHCAGETR